MEFKLLNPSNENGFIKSIEFNFDELKGELTQRLEKYNNLTYSENEIKNAKEDRAGLNKFKDAIETRRKEIKALHMKPYNEFEAKVKELVALVDEPIKAINTQLDNFEDQRKSAKRIDIEDFYNDAIGDMAEILPLARIFDEKWLNATVKMNAIEKAITETIGEVKGNLKVIADLKLSPDMELQVKDKYLQTLNFGYAMAEKTRLENLKDAIAAQEIREENKPDEQIHQEVANQPEIEPQIKENDTNIYFRKFWVRGPKEKLMKLGKFLQDLEIEFGGIK